MGATKQLMFDEWEREYEEETREARLEHGQNCWFCGGEMEFDECYEMRADFLHAAEKDD